MYITKDGVRLEGHEGLQAAAKESQVPYSQIMQQVQAVGATTSDKQSLEYWGLPSGLCHAL